MKNKLFKKAGALTLALALIVGIGFQHAQASTTHFDVEQIFHPDSSHYSVYFIPNVSGVLGSEQGVNFSSSGITTEQQLRTAENNAIVAWANSDGGFSGVTASDIFQYSPALATVATTGSYADLTNLPAVPSINNTPSHSIVTTAASANGFQISSTRNTSVFYSVNIATTATIGGSADGYVVLEVAATNSSTASDWKEISRFRNGQSISLAVALQSVQNIGGELMGVVPVGYYVRLRSVNSNGTPTFTYVSGQEVQL